MSLLRVLTALTLLMLTACGSKNAGDTADSAKLTATGDWDRASNLPEAIYDVQNTSDDRSGMSFTVSFYNLDHTSTSDIFQQVKFTRSTGTNMRSSLAAFSAKMDCNSSCKSGAFTIKHDSPGSKLNGSIRVQFTISSLILFSQDSSFQTNDDLVESSIARAFEMHYLLGGTVEQYQINGGWVSPFQLNLDYAVSFISHTPDETIRFHGTQPQNGSLLLGIRDHSGDQTSHLPAVVSFPAKDSIEICFENGHLLKGVGAYGPSHTSAPLSLCSASNL